VAIQFGGPVLHVDETERREGVGDIVCIAVTAFFVLIFSGLVLRAATTPPERVGAVSALASGEHVEGTIRSGTVEHWALHLKPGDYFEACLEFHEMGLSLSLEARVRDSKTTNVESAPQWGAPGTCLRAVIARNSTYLLHIAAISGGPATENYRLEVKGHPQVPSDARQIATQRLLKQAADHVSRFSFNSLSMALSLCKQALSASQNIPDIALETSILLRLAEIESWLGDWRNAVSYADMALDRMDDGAFVSGRLSVEYVHSRATARLKGRSEGSESLTSVLNSAHAAHATTIEALTLFSLGQGQLPDQPQQAEHYFQLAVATARAVKNQALERTVYANIGDAYFAAEDWRKAALYYDLAQQPPNAFARAAQIGQLGRLALALLHVGDTERTESILSRAERITAGYEAHTLATLHRDIGNAYRSAGNPEMARSHYARATRFAGNDHRLNIDLENLIADCSHELADLPKALTAHEAALSIARRFGEKRDRARALLDVGEDYALLGDHESAIVHISEALQLFTDDPLERAEALNSLGENLLLVRDNPLQADVEKRRSHRRELAFEAFNKALRLRHDVDREGEADTLGHLGGLYSDIGNLEKAIDLLQQSANIRRDMDDREGLAEALEALGNAHLAADHKQTAIAIQQDALDLRRRLPDRIAEASTLASLAAALGADDQLEDALANAERAVKLIEIVRKSISIRDLRIRLLADIVYIYGVCTNINLQLYGKHPSAGYDVKALEWRERSLARELLDNSTLVMARLGRPKQSPQRTFQTQQQLLSGVQQQREQTSDEKAPDTPGVAVETRKGGSSTMGAQRLAPEEWPIDIADIQKLLPTDGLLLDYDLGDTGSVWAVTRQSVSVFRTPKLAEIEPLIRDCFNYFSERTARGTCPAGNLMAMLFGAVEHLLPGKRIIITGDAILGFVPFAALPDPRPGRYLFSDIITVPSASFIATQRQRVLQSPGPKNVLVFAAPVTDSADNGLREKTLRGPVERPSDSVVFPAVQSEMINLFAIQAAAGDRVVSHTGFTANRQTALSELPKYSIIDFSVHGYFDTTSQKFVGLVLSTYDSQGRRIPGFLTVEDVSKLRLKAEIVMLGVCDTGRGELIPGEGTISMSRAFLFAGARRVLATLWPVYSDAASVFVATFYDALLKRGLDPESSLREARSRVRAVFPSPHYWAAFVLQGDWS
jgi:CHAT domain-containing protein